MVFTKNEKPTRIGIIFFLCFILVSALFIGFNLNIKTINAFSPVQAVVNNSASTSALSTGINTNPVDKNDYIIVMIDTQNGGTISSVKDTLENTFNSVISQTNTELAAIYIAQNTNKTASDSVTVTFGATQANVTVGIAEMQQINNITADITGSGHGTGGVVTKLSASIQPNLNDGCFATGIAANSGSNTILIPNGKGVDGNFIDSGFANLFIIRSSSSAGVSFGTFSDYPNATQTTLAQMLSYNPTNSNTPTLGTWEEVAACFHQSSVTTTTTTSTTTSITTTSSTTTTTTAQSTSITTTTSTTTNTSSTTIGFAVSTTTTIPITYFELVIWIALLILPVKNILTLMLIRIVAAIFGIVSGIDALAGTLWLNIIGNTFTLVHFDDGMTPTLSAAMIFVSGIVLAVVWQTYAKIDNKGELLSGN